MNPQQTDVVRQAIKIATMDAEAKVFACASVVIVTGLVACYQWARPSSEAKNIVLIFVGTIALFAVEGCACSVFRLLKIWLFPAYFAAKVLMP